MVLFENIKKEGQLRSQTSAEARRGKTSPAAGLCRRSVKGVRGVVVGSSRLRGQPGSCKKERLPGGVMYLREKTIGARPGQEKRTGGHNPRSWTKKKASVAISSLMKEKKKRAARERRHPLSRFPPARVEERRANLKICLRGGRGRPMRERHSQSG